MSGVTFVITKDGVFVGYRSIRIKFLRCSALPSPKRLAFAEALAQAGYAQAGLQPPRPPYLRLGFDLHHGEKDAYVLKTFLAKRREKIYNKVQGEEK